MRAAPPGSLDGDVATCLGAALDEIVDSRRGAVVVDLSEVDEVPPAGLHMLVRVAVQAAGPTSGSDPVRSAIAGAGRELFDLHVSIGEELEALGVSD